jgi:hypothetical protein
VEIGGVYEAEAGQRDEIGRNSDHTTHMSRRGRGQCEGVPIREPMRR